MREMMMMVMTTKIVANGGQAPLGIGPCIPEKKTISAACPRMLALAATIRRRWAHPGSAKAFGTPLILQLVLGFRKRE